MDPQAAIPLNGQDAILKAAAANAAAAQAVQHQTFWNNMKFLLDYANQWAPVFILLMCELVLCTAMILPIPIQWRAKISQQMSRLWNLYPRFRIVMKTFIGIVTALFLDALRQMYMVHLSQRQPDLLKVGKEGEMNNTLVAAQRNAFMCGFTVFLFMVLYRMQSMADQISGLEDRLNLVDSDLTRKREGFVKREYGTATEKERLQNNLDVKPIDADIKLRQRPTAIVHDATPLSR